MINFTSLVLGQFYGATTDVQWIFIVKLYQFSLTKELNQFVFYPCCPLECYILQCASTTQYWYFCPWLNDLHQIADQGLNHNLIPLPSLPAKPTGIFCFIA